MVKKEWGIAHMRWKQYIHTTQNTNLTSSENIYKQNDKQLEGFYHWRKISIKTFPCEKKLLSDEQSLNNYFPQGKVFMEVLFSKHNWFAILDTNWKYFYIRHFKQTL